MKATEYIDKYSKELENAIQKSDDKKVLNDILCEFINETNVITKERHISNMKSLVSLIKEQNQKYNKFCRLMNEKLGLTYFKENGFREFVISENPTIQKHFN